LNEAASRVAGSWHLGFETWGGLYVQAVYPSVYIYLLFDSLPAVHPFVFPSLLMMDKWCNEAPRFPEFFWGAVRCSFFWSNILAQVR